MHHCLWQVFVSAVAGFVLAVAFASNINEELKTLHEKADAILQAVRGH